MMRELYTLSACVDSLLRGKPCHALHLITQRMKAVESTLSGVHWSISQRLELLPQDIPGLTPTQEVREAQKDAYSDQKTKYLASQPEGRTKGYDKGKGAGKFNTKDAKKGSKGGGAKGDGKKQQKDDAPQKG